MEKTGVGQGAVMKKPTWSLHGPTMVEHDSDSRVTWSGMWTIFDALGLIAILLIQGSVLNFYLISYNEGNSGWYFWFLIDFVILIAFIFSIAFAWHYYQRQRRERATLRSPFRHAEERTKRFGKGIFKFTFPKPMGMLPLIYVCWIGYSLALVVKIYLVIVFEIPEQMIKDGTTRGGEVLALSFAGAAVVFLLWVEAHRNLEDETNRQLSKSSIDDLISHTSFEIFDSVIFLNMIIPEDKAELAADAENISLALRNFILVLATVNFLMPALGLYRLSRTHFGEKTNGRLKVVNESTGLLSTRGLGVSIVYHLLRLFAINVPYLIIRIHMSKNIGKDMSIFILKNILGIWVAMRTVIPEIRQWVTISKLKEVAKRERAAGAAAARPTIKVEKFDPTRGWEMPTLYEHPRQPGNEISVDHDAITAAIGGDELEPMARSAKAERQLPSFRTAESVDSTDIIEEQFKEGLLTKY